MSSSPRTGHNVLRAAALTALLVAGPASAVDLIGVHDLALKNDPILQAAAFRRDATGENERQAFAGFLPALSGSANTFRGDDESRIDGRGLFPDVTRENDIDSESWSLDLNQVVYDQANYERLDLARGQVSQAEAIYQAAYQDFLVRVAVNYFEVLTTQDRVIFAEAEELALQRQFEQAEQKFEVGLTAITDVYEARASYDNARARAIVARNELADAKEGLRQLTGQYFDEVDALQEELPLVDPDPNNIEEWVQTALEFNPFVVQARFATDIADANVRLQRTGHFPTLNLSAGYSDFTNNSIQLTNDIGEVIATTSLEAQDFRYGLVLNVPIYQGGLINSRTRQARFELGAVQQDLEDQQRFTMRETRNAFRAVVAGIEQVQAFGQALISGESALEATQAGFEVGTRTIVDVLLAQQRFYGAARDNSLARHTYILNHLRLKLAAGLLTEQDLRQVNTILE
ncbi:MAG: TolC family outer membrane protein [Xanthomonadales bacterium]|jgi:outer membrane protein|nr:TolC family outer membrane protein [Xanthomonadales bacterium]